MAAVRIDAKAFADPRFALLGRLLGTSRRDALGGMAELWNYCTEQGTYRVTPLIVDAIFEREGAHELVVSADLAELEDGVLRVKGCEGRIEWLAERRAAGAKGGKATVKKRKKRGEANAKQTPSKSLSSASTAGEANGYPLTLTPALTTKEKEHAARSDTPDPPTQESLPQVMAPAAPVAVGMREVTDGWFALYAEYNAGAKSTWGGHEGKLAKELLRSHRPLEILRRAGIMFRAPPIYPRGPNPDFKTLANNFDRFAVEVADGRTGSARASPTTKPFDFNGLMNA